MANRHSLKIFAIRIAEMEKCVYLCRISHAEARYGHGRDAVFAMTFVVAIHNESVYLR